MDRDAWLDYLDKDLATRSQDNGTLWRYGFVLLVTAASLSVFVARTFDASAGPPTRASGVLMALALSAAVYVLLVDRLVRRFIRMHPPLRVLTHPQDEDAVLPLGYRLLNPESFALVSIGVTFVLLPNTPLPWGPEWLKSTNQILHPVIPVLFVVAGLALAIVEGRRPTGLATELLQRVHQSMAFPLVVLALAGLAFVPLGSLFEFIQSAEAGIAMMGVACIPALFLSGIQVLRWAAFDHSLQRMELLRLDARRGNWPADRIEQVYFTIETERARGPVPAQSPREASSHQRLLSWLEGGARAAW